MAYNNLMCFLKYITYRTNIGIYTAEVFYLNHQGQKDYQGLLVFKRQNELETNKTASDQIIKYDVLKAELENYSHVSSKKNSVFSIYVNPLIPHIITL